MDRPEPGRRVIALVLTSTLASTVAAEESAPAPRVLLGEIFAYEEEFVDLDSATSLSRPVVGGVRAEFLFARRDGRLAILPIEPARLAALEFRTLDQFEEQLDLSAASGETVSVQESLALVGRTSEGLAFKATIWPCSEDVSIGRPARVAWWDDPKWIFVEVALQLDGSDRIARRVEGLLASFSGSQIGVEWRGDPSERHRVRCRGSAGESSLDVQGSRASFACQPEGDLGATPRADPVYGIEVVRLLEDGGQSEPARTSVLAASAGIERSILDLRRGEHEEQIRVNLREGRSDDADPDLLAFSYGFKTPLGGGVRLLGEGEDLFEQTRTLPEFGYAPRVESFREDFVYAVRLRDGRYIKMRVRPESDTAETLIADCVFIRSGGREIQAGPVAGEGSFDGRSVTLRWESRPGAREYAISRMDGTSWISVGRTTQTSLADEAAESNAFLVYGLAWLSPEGASSDLSLVRVPTFLPPLVVGRFTLRQEDSKHPVSFSFASGEVASSESGDIVASTWSFAGRFDTPHGSYRGIEGGFGKVDARKLPDVMRHLRQKEVQVDDRDLERRTFEVRTAGGGFAHVRLLSELHDVRGTGATFEYVFLPPPDVDTILTFLMETTSAVSPEDMAYLDQQVRELDSDDFEERERAQTALSAKGRAAAGALEKGWKENRSQEARARLEILIRAAWEESR